MTHTKTQRKAPPPIVFIAIALVGAFAVPKLIAKVNPSTSTKASNPKTTDPQTRIPKLSLPFLTTKQNNLGSQAFGSSLGEQVLIPVGGAAKAEASQLFSQKDYGAAQQSFEQSLQQQLNDPEARIYLNNAQAAQGEFYRVAIAVPLGSNLNIAQEMLRGAAQAQDEINQRGGIQGKRLQIQIVDDQNDPELAKTIAQSLIDDEQVSAVIGHNASTVSLATGPIYQQAGLVMLSPTSTANELSQVGNFVFRTAPHSRAMASLLAQHVVQTDAVQQVALCYDSQNASDVSFKDSVESAMMTLGASIVPIACDVSTTAFDPAQAIEQAIAAGADGLMLTSHIDRIDQVVALARVNRGRLPLYGTSTLYTMQTLSGGQGDVEGLTLPVPWHPTANQNAGFTQQARQLWGGAVNWRTASTYDATWAIATAISQSQGQPTRQSIQQAMQRPDFVVQQGAGQAVRFTPTGDRQAAPVLIQVQRQGSGQLQFVPLTGS